MKQRRVLLHVGAGKTGTSAIQAWLARNHRRLEEHGVHYPEPPVGFAEAVEGRITSGNAGMLAGFAMRKDERGFDAAPRFVAWLDEVLRRPAETILFSSEILQRGGEGRLAQLKTYFEERGFGVTIIYAVRNVADHSFSKWGQMVKRHGEFVDWERFCQRDAVRFPAILDRFARVFGRQAIEVVNYERCKHDIVRRVLALVTPIDFGDTQVERINRSLSARETELMRAFNHAVVQHTKEAPLRASLATGLSDFFIYGADLEPMKLALTEAQFASLNERHGEVVDALNRTYLPDDPIMVADPKAVTGALPREALGRADRVLMRRLAACAVRGAVDFATLKSGGDCLGALAEAVGNSSGVGAASVKRAGDSREAFDGPAPARRAMGLSGRTR